MKKRRSLKEAISQTVTPQEQQALAFVKDYSIRNNLASIIDFSRAKGKQIDLRGAAKQLAQYFQSQGRTIDSDLQNLISRPDVPKPPREIQQVQPPINRKQPPKPPSFLIQNGDQYRTESGEFDAERASRDLKALVPQVNLATKGLDAGSTPAASVTPEQRQQRTKELRNKFRNNSPVNQKLQRESKTMIKNKKQLKEAVTRIVITEKRRTMAKNILKEQLSEQVQIRNGAAYLLKEGPLSNVWQKMKSAGSAVSSAMGGYKDIGKDNVQTQQQERAREVVGGITKLISKVHQQRQKWNGQILKSAEMMSQYHDSVVNVYELYKKYQGFLGPAGNEVNRQVNELIDALQKDLMSEVSQIQAMLKSLGTKDVSLDSMLKTHQADAEEKREKEADLNPMGVTSFQRGAPNIRGGQSTGQEMMRKIRPQTTPRDEKPKSKKEEAQEATNRVGAGDKKVYRNYEAQMKDIEDAYKEQTDDLAKRALKATDKKEREHAVQQMYELARARKQREKELREKLKGIGIRSKAGMTLAKGAYGASA